jgi:hypothetical protein
VILVPGSLVWKWHDDILCTLPDYRVAVIGSKRKRISRGVRKNVVTSETDTPQERAKKWTMLQTGQLDVVVLSYDALARTKMNEDAVMAYVEQVEAVSRSIALRKRSLEEQAQTAKQREKLSERERALLEHGVRAWIEEILALPSDLGLRPRRRVGRDRHRHARHRRGRGVQEPVQAAGPRGWRAEVHGRRRRGVRPGVAARLSCRRGPAARPAAPASCC